MSQIAEQTHVLDVYGKVDLEFKLRPFSAGSILTLRNRIEPLAGNTVISATLTARHSIRSRMFIATSRSNYLSSVGAKCDSLDNISLLRSLLNHIKGIGL